MSEVFVRWRGSVSCPRNSAVQAPELEEETEKRWGKNEREMKRQRER